LIIEGGNDKGRFIKVGLAPGLYRFTASKEGYRSASVDHEVRLGGRTTIPEIALISMEKIRKAQGDALNKKFTQAAELARSNQFDEAEVLLKELREEIPTVPEVHLNLAWVYVQRQDRANAEASCLKTLKLSPGDPQATAGLSGVYMETGRGAEAQELVNRAARENPEDATAQFELAIFLMNSGKTAEAIPALEASRADDDTLAEAHFHLGPLLVGKGKIPEALQHRETYLSIALAVAVLIGYE
jgi:Flp pilus assembly protein TadD